MNDGRAGLSFRIEVVKHEQSRRDTTMRKLDVLKHETIFPIARNGGLRYINQARQGLSMLMRCSPPVRRAGCLLISW